MTSIKSKVLIILLCIFTFFGIIYLGLLHFLIFPSYLAMEQEEAIKDTNRCVKAIQREIHYLNSMCHDWAAWDDTYKFVESLSKNYIKANFTISTFIDNKFNLIYICNTEGKIVWKKIIDLETTKFIHLSAFPKDYLPKGHPLITYNTKTKNLLEITNNGILMTDQGPMLVASRPILTSNNKGPIRGFVIMGRFLNDKMIHTLVEQTSVDFTILPGTSKPISQDHQRILSEVSIASPHLIKQNDDHVVIYMKFPRMIGTKPLFIQSRIPKKISTKGAITIQYASYYVLIAGCGILIVMLLLLQQTVIRPITNLTNHILSIKKSGDLTSRLSSGRKDEIGQLSNAFDDTLHQLENMTTNLYDLNATLERDIKKRQQIENALRESRERFRDIVLCSSDWIWEVGLNGQYTYVDGNVFKVLGYHPHELVGMTPFDLMQEGESEKIQNTFKEISSAKAPIRDLENWNTNKNGKLVCLQTSGVPFFNNTGELIGYRGVDKDISERKNTEKALIESEEKYRFLTEEHQDVVIRFSTEEVFEYCSPAIRSFAGYDPEQVVGTSISEYFVIKEEYRHAHQVIKKHVLSQTAATVEFLFKTAGKEPFYVEVSGKPVVIDGQVVTIQCVIRDISERKKANDALQESLQTLKIAQDQLVQSAKMAALGGLVAGVSHEINTPVGVGILASSFLEDSITTYRKFLESGKADHTKHETFINKATEASRIIQHNLKQAAEIISSFKLVAVDQSNELQREFNLKEYVNGVLVSLEPKFKHTSHSITLNCSDDLIIDSHPSVFFQIITNLVMNSLSHGFEGLEKGKILLDIWVEDNSLQLLFSDNGNGMGDDTQQKIFDPFFTTKRGKGGTGLGMHIVFNLVTQALNGQIQCNSSPGNGSEFLIQIPLDA